MTITQSIINYFNKNFYFPQISVIDIIEIVILMFLFYKIMVWFRKTRAWNLIKGIIIILCTILIATILNFTTISWIAEKFIGIGIIAIVIIFQPELRRALEQLGKKSIFKKIFKSASNKKQKYTDETIDNIVNAITALSEEKVGALICLENDISLLEYENTGIEIDSEVSSALINNIFIDKSPLHDGAIIIRDNRIAAATCYLPITKNEKIDKKYGTRHRAAVGISEVTDALTIIVSEETGEISYTYSGELYNDVSKDKIKEITNEKTNI